LKGGLSVGGLGDRFERTSLGRTSFGHWARSGWSGHLEETLMAHIFTSSFPNNYKNDFSHRTFPPKSRTSSFFLPESHIHRQHETMQLQAISQGNTNSLSTSIYRVFDSGRSTRRKVCFSNFLGNYGKLNAAVEMDECSMSPLAYGGTNRILR